MWEKPRKVNEVPSVSGWSVPFGRLLRKSTKRRLVGMESESIPSKALAQYVEDPFGIEGILECHHGIIGEPNKGTSPLETWPHLEFEPFIQHVMQENVREAG